MSALGRPSPRRWGPCRTWPNFSHAALPLPNSRGIERSILILSRQDKRIRCVTRRQFSIAWRSRNPRSADFPVCVAQVFQLRARDGAGAHWQADAPPTGKSAKRRLESLRYGARAERGSWRRIAGLRNVLLQIRDSLLRSWPTAVNLRAGYPASR